MLNATFRREIYDSLVKEGRTEEEITEVLTTHWDACVSEVAFYRYGQEIVPGSLFDVSSFMNWSYVLDDANIGVKVPQYNLLNTLNVKNFIHLDKETEKDIARKFRFVCDFNSKNYLRYDFPTMLDLPNLGRKYPGLRKNVLGKWAKLGVDNEHYQSAVMYPGGDVPILSVEVGDRPFISPVKTITVVNGEVVNDTSHKKAALLNEYLNDNKIFPRHPQYVEKGYGDDKLSYTISFDSSNTLVTSFPVGCRL